MSGIAPEKIAEWKEIIDKQKNSGLSIERWCKNHQVLPHQFYYWKKRLFPQPVSFSHLFTELKDKDKNKSVMTIEYQGFHLHIDRQSDMHLLKGCLLALKEAL